MSVDRIALPANLAWLGGKREATYGTAASSNPDFWIPVDGSSLKYKPNINPLVDQAFRGMMSADFQQVAGMRYDSLAYKSYAYMDSIYQHFLALLGRPDAVTGTADPWTHKTAVENGVDQAQAQPMSFTLWYFDGAQCWQITGCIEASAKLSVKVDDLITLEATWMGLPATQVATPTNTPSTNKPMPSWNAILSVGGTPVDNKSECTVELKRDSGAVNTINNSQSPLSIFGGGVSSTINLNAVYKGGSTDADMAAFLANTQTSLAVKIAPVSDATHALTLQQSVYTYDSTDINHGNKWSEITSQGKGLANATDALDSKESCAQVIFTSPQSAAF
jgi:tail tube protein